MKALVIYDSNLGNTKLIAETIAAGLGEGTCSLSVVNVKADDLMGVGLLVVGSPIVGWKPTERMQQFLAGLKPGQLTGIKATTFDTRVKLFIHGDADGWAAMNSVKCWEQLRRMGIQSDLHTLAGRDHCFQRSAAPGTGSYTWMGRIWEFMNHKGFNK